MYECMTLSVQIKQREQSVINYRMAKMHFRFLVCGCENKKLFMCSQEYCGDFG